SQEAKAKRLKLEEDKAEKIEEITQFQADRTYDIQIEALDAEYEAYAKMIDQQLAGIDLVIAGFDAMIDKINEMIDALSRMSSAGGGSGGGSGGNSKYKGSLATSANPFASNQIGNSAVVSAGINDWINQAGSGYHTGGLVESHHDGDFAGSLNSNEVFAKLLKGEYVSTEVQMKNFLSDILPKMMIGSSSIIQNKDGNSNGINIGDININVSGNLDKVGVQDIKTAVFDALNQTNIIRGKRANVFTNSI
ncbi:MAG: hypothetical protein M0Q12_05740, partial [Synergistaceae bacterium]|nr:hypothetical protein [Synergistaceae bacterium]